jgi:kumamolisin
MMSTDGNDAELQLVPLDGSERLPAQGFASAAAPLKPGGTIEATVVLRRPAGFDRGAALAPSAGMVGPIIGADPADLELVSSTLGQFGVDILRSDARSRRIRISGSLSTMSRVFGTELTASTDSGPEPSVTHRHRSGGLMIPRALDGIIVAVLGLDDRPQARAEFRIAEPRAISTSYTPPELATIYDFPVEHDGVKLDGAGQTIAIIELGGGFAQSELDSYFSGLGITGPTVTAVGVDSAENVPGKDAGGADGEVLLDIEVAGALSPGADIVVYFAPNTDDGFLDAVSEATMATPTPTAISISWGQSEDAWTPQARNALDEAFVDAAALGVTVTAAAGDNGSSDGVADGHDHADFPASSPHALACGGTTLEAADGTVRSETVWNNGDGQGATGGGVSAVFGLPDWQKKAGVPTSAGQKKAGRGVPDVAAVADPSTGYRVLVDGKSMVIGGTSAVSPLWAALIARLAQAKGSSLGLIQPTLYAAATPVCRDVVTGNNGSYSADAGWDACTGLGVPDGAGLLALFTGR